MNATDLPPYWRLPHPDTMLTSARLCVAAGTLSLAASVFVCVLYLRLCLSLQKGRRHGLLSNIVSPHNHFIFS